MLPLRPFGKTGFNLSPLGLGTVKLGRNQKIKYAPFDLPDDHAVLQLLDTALECGINLLDTAPAYGAAEERLGQLLGPRRERFHIFTKAGESFAEGLSTYHFSRAAIEQSVATSLKRLRTDRLDCVLLHCAANDVENILQTSALDVLGALKQRGDILSFGISTMSFEGGMIAVDRADAVMVSHNPEYTAERPVIAAAAQRGKGILIKKGFCSGNLQSLGTSDPVTACIHSALNLPGHPILVVGTIHPAHLRQNASAAARFLNLS